MPDLFDDRSSGLESPGAAAAQVLPSDAADLSVSSRALYIGTGGDLQITTVSGSVVSLKNVPVGILPLRVRRVHATGTSASDIVAVW